MKQPTFYGKELLPLSVIEAARAGDQGKEGLEIYQVFSGDRIHRVPGQDRNV